MRKVALFTSISLLACLIAPQWSPAAVIYRSNEGWSVEGDASKVESNAAEQMRKAEEYEKAGNDKASS